MLAVSSVQMMTEPTFLDFSKPGFSTKSPAVRSARANHWCARTPLGFAVLSYEHVGRLLRDRRLRQGSYAWPESRNANGSFAKFWKRSLISMEGAQHKKIRSLTAKAMSDEFVLSLNPRFDEIAKKLILKLTAKKKCEFQSEFSMPFSGQAICTLLGLPIERWFSIANDASTLGLAMGLDYKSHEAKINKAYDNLSELADELIYNAKIQKTCGGLVNRLITFLDDFDDISYREIADLIVIIIFGGVDTTRSQLGFFMAIFAQYPKDWETLRNDASLIPGAIEESIRVWPTTTWATRETIQNIEIDGVLFPKGATIHLLVHSSAKDPALGDIPEFDIQIKQKMHHGFGGGAHHCLGHFVARTDMASAVRAIAASIKSFYIHQPPVYLPDSGNTSLEILPLAYEPAKSNLHEN